MQDQFYKTKKHFSKYFSSLEPLTLEYLNSSIKKEFIHNDFFISKIFLRSSSDKYYDYVNAAFNEKTTIVVVCSKSDYEYVQKNQKDNEIE